MGTALKLSCMLVAVLLMLTPAVRAHSSDEETGGASVALVPGPGAAAGRGLGSADELLAGSEASIAAGQATTVIITIRTTPADLTAAAASQSNPAPPGSAAGASYAPEVATRLRANSDVKQRVAGRAGVQIQRDLDHLPVAVVTVSSAVALEALKASPEVVAVQANGIKRRTLNESLPLISQPAAAKFGFLGEGCVVGVLDSGVDYLRAVFGACVKPGDPGCSVVFARDYTPADDGELDDKSMHGTNVAAIVLGVAPNAKILSMDVFDGDSAADADVLAALNDAIKMKVEGRYNVCAVNLALGDDFAAPHPCGGEVAYESAFAAARSAGILPAVSSGNNAKTSQIARPACCPSAVSVGAVYDSDVGRKTYSDCKDFNSEEDKVVCFSNSASYLSLLAPGSEIEAAGIVMSGTSQAAAHVAGAAAVLMSAVPQSTVDQVLQALQLSGTPVLDGRNGITKPRINVDAAVTQLQLLINPPSAAKDTDPPIGSVHINGRATFTFSRTVNIFLTGSDPSGVSIMCISNNAPTLAQCTNFEQFAKVKANWELEDGPDGDRTVYVYLADFPSNFMTVPLTYTIKLVTNKVPSYVSVNRDSGYAGARLMRLEITAQGGNSQTEYCVTDNATSSAACGSQGGVGWSKYKGDGMVAYKSLPMGAEEGIHTTRVFFRDTNRPTVAWHAAEATFVYDETRPAVRNDVVDFRASSASKNSITVRFRPAKDALSGVAYHIVSWRKGDKAPPVCARDAWSPSSRFNAVLWDPQPGSQGYYYVTIPNIKAGKALSFTLCAVDKASNIATGPTLTGVATVSRA